MWHNIKLWLQFWLFGWLGGLAAIIALAVNIFNFPSNLGIIMDQLPDWVTENWARLILGSISFLYVGFIALPLIRDGFSGTPNFNLRDAFKYLMLDSKWSIGKKFDPFDSSGSSRSPSCQLYGQMANNIEEAAKSGKIKVWVNNDVELERPRWENLNIELTTCMGFGDSAVVLDHSIDPVGQLANTMVNKRQFFSLWPKANQYEKYKDKELYVFRYLFYIKEYRHNND